MGGLFSSQFTSGTLPITFVRVDIKNNDICVLVLKERWSQHLDFGNLEHLLRY